MCVLWKTIPMKKVSIFHVNKSVSQELQADFLVAYVRGERLNVVNMVDADTGFEESVFVPSRNAEVMKAMIGTKQFCQHGAPKKFSADPELCQDVLRTFMESHDIGIVDRPLRSSNKNEIIERKNGVFKTTPFKISQEKKNDPPETLITRASLLTNLLHRSGTLSTFQLARSYSSFILVLPPVMVTEEILTAHMEISASRALYNTLKYKIPRDTPSSMLSQDAMYWCFTRPQEKMFL